MGIHIIENRVTKSNRHYGVISSQCSPQTLSSQNDYAKVRVIQRAITEIALQLNLINETVMLGNNFY